MPEGAINVTRGTDWGNPFRVGATVLCSDGGWPRHHSVTITPALAVALFAACVEEKGYIDQIKRELCGHDLVCWCSTEPGTPCHGNWLLAVANA